MPTEVIVGLFTLGGTLAGAVFGFTGQWVMERQRTERTRVGIVKAMVGELRHNGAAAVGFLRIGPAIGRAKPLMTYSAETWKAAKFELAQFLPDAHYDALLLIYEDWLPAFEKLSETPSSVFPEWPDSKVTDFLNELIKRIDHAMDGLLSLPEAASFRNRPEYRHRVKDMLQEEGLTTDTARD